MALVASFRHRSVRSTQGAWLVTQSPVGPILLASRPRRIGTASRPDRVRRSAGSAAAADAYGLQPRRTRPAGSGRGRRAADPDRLAGDHAGHRRAHDRRHTRLRLVVPERQRACEVPAGLDLFRPDRAGGVGRAGAYRHAAGRRDLDRLARPRPGQAARLRQQAARGAGGLARLEVAVHLPGPARGVGQPAHRAGQRPDPLYPDLGQRDELVLRAAARQPDLHHERHGVAAAPDR